MRSLGVHPVQKQYPVLYWTTVAYIVGVPNFLHFDSTGRTHAEGLFNLTSISNIALTLLSGYLLFFVLLLSKHPIFPRKLSFGAALWLTLLGEFTLATLLQPASRLTPPSATELPMSLYRLGGWVLAFLLVLVLYARSPAERALELLVQLIGRVSWIWVFMTWLILPIMPGQVYGSADDSVSVTRAQLGGQLIHPSILATLAILAFFYNLLVGRPGLRRYAGCGLCCITIVLAHTRTEQATFAFLLLLYVVLVARSAALRFSTALITVVTVMLGIVFREALLKYVARGQSAASLATLDDRTRVWQAGLDAIKDRPIIGYGFTAGAKNALRDHWIYVHWIPPHAHNELIHTALAGGMIAVILVVAIYGLALWTSFRASRRSPMHALLFLFFAQILVKSMFGPILSLPFSSVGGIFTIAFIASIGDARYNAAVARSAATRRAIVPRLPVRAPLTAPEPA